MEKKKIRIRTYEMGESVFSSIIFLIFGIFLITNPEGIINTAVIILGSLLALFGLFKILIYYKTTNGNKKDNITGAVYIIVGMAAIICALAFSDSIKTALRFIISIYLLYVGIYRFVYAFKAKGDKKPYFINAGIIILIAILLLTIPGLFGAPLIAIGVLITLFAIAEIVGFILGRKNGNGIEVREAVIVSEKIETNNEDVKLLK